MNWITFPDKCFEINGLPWWQETSPQLVRLPDRMKDDVTPAVWNLSRAPSGARIRFRTDAADLSIRLHSPDLTYMDNMPRVGQLGADAWVDGEYWNVVYPIATQHETESAFFTGQSKQMREIAINLGLYGPVEVDAIGVNEGAAIEAATPFAVQKPVVYYGTSITQGGCATRASMSYQAIVSRTLNVDFINLGFSGNGKGEPALARAVAEIDASCFVMDMNQNNPSAEDLETVYAPFMQTIRDSHPITPIICNTGIFTTTEICTNNTEIEAKREVIRRAVADRISSGDNNIAIVEGYDMLGPDDRDGLVDATHPNDIGFAHMAERLEPYLRAALKL